MANLKALGIVKGRTVTADMIAAASKDSLPEKAIDQLWLRRTLNKSAMTIIEAAIAPTQADKPVKTKKDKVGE